MLTNLSALDAAPNAAPPPAIYDRFVKIGLLLSLALFGIFLIWATVAELDEGVVAEGTISVESRRKTIQHLEGGIISQVLVQEGDQVQAGDILIQLETTQSRARRDQAQTQLLTSWARLDRLNAERRREGTIGFRPELLSQSDSLITEIRDVQQNLFDARQTQISGQIDILEQRIQQLEDQIDGLNSQREAAERQILLIQDEIDRYEQVEALQATDVRNKLQRERELAQTQGQLGQIDADVARIRVSIGEAQIEILQVDRTFQESVAAELTEAQDRALSLQDEVRALDDILARTDIIAPASGDILNLQFSTIGGVIPPGQPILEIVPLADELVVEARVPLNDVDNVTIGQDVRTTIAALNQRTTPELLGTVVSVGADSINDPITGLPFFPVRIAFNEGEMTKLGDQSLRPGMIVQAFIQGGQRTPLDYLLQPITDTLKKALRES